MTLLIIQNSKHFLLFFVTEEARRSWIWGGAGVSMGLLIVVCDQYLTDTPTMQVTSGVYTVAIIGGSRAGTDNPLSATNTYPCRLRSMVDITVRLDYSEFHRSKENIFLTVICKMFNTKSQDTLYRSSYKKEQT